MAKLTTYQVTEIAKDTWVINEVNRSPSSRQLKKYKFFLPVEIYLLAVFMRDCEKKSVNKILL